MKQKIEDLAIFGGPAAFLQPLYVGRPSTGDRSRLLEWLNWALDNQWLTNGPLVREFEERVADVAGVRNCVATCNATIALQLLYMATKLSDEVIMPSMTYVATAHAARMAGLTPVFCDIDPETGCLDPREAEAAVTSRTSGEVGVHLWGRPSPIDELEKVAVRHGLQLIFDAAHALGCSCRGRRIGGFGAAEVFSFHATKVVNSFEGGAIVTDDGLAQHLRSLRFLPHTERLADQVLALPTGPAVSREDIRRVCDIVRCAIKRGQQVTDRFRRNADPSSASADPPHATR